jgi:hypothetical protein
MCPKGHVLNGRRVEIATAKKRKISTLTSKIFRYASAVELCSEDGDGMSKSEDDLRAALGEAPGATAPGGLDGVFSILGQLMERSEERHREALEATEQRHRQEMKRSSELTLDLFKKLSTRIDDRCDQLEQRMMMPAAEAAPQTMVEKVVKDIAEIATLALRKYVNQQ